MVDKFLAVPAWDDKVDIVLNVVKEVYPNIPEVDLRLAINRLVRRLYISLQYEPSSTQQKGVLLVKGERELVQSGLLPADYGLSEVMLLFSCYAYLICIVYSSCFICATVLVRKNMKL